MLYNYIYYNGQNYLFLIYVLKSFFMFYNLCYINPYFIIPF